MSTAPDVPETGSRWGLSDAALWFGVSIIGQSMWALILVGLLHGGVVPDAIPVSTLFLIQLWLWFAYGVGPVVTTMRRGNGPVVDLGLRIEPRDAWQGVLVGVVVQLVALPLIYYPILRIVDVDPSEAAEQLVGLINTPLDVVLMVVIVAIAAPVVEEIFYRGLLLEALRQRLSDNVAVVVQALVFALAHMQGVQFVGLFVVGLVLGYLKVRSGRLGPAIAAHFGFNAVTLGLLLSQS